MTPGTGEPAAGQDGKCVRSEVIRHDQIDWISTEWLPEALYSSIRQYEHVNFQNLVEAVEALATTIPDAAAACSNQPAVLAADPLLSQITTCARDPELLYEVCALLFCSGSHCIWTCG